MHVRPAAPKEISRRAPVSGAPGGRRTGPPRRVRAALSPEHATSGLYVGRLVVSPEQVVFVKGVVEASEGLAALFAERGGDLSIASPHDRAEELAELLRDLASDLGGSFQLEAPRDQGAHPASASNR